MRRWMVFVLLVGFFAPVWAQQYSADKPVGTAAQSTPSFLKKAGVDQNLNKELPLGDHFVDSDGRDVTLGTYFAHRPVVMAQVYYKCRMLCPQVLSGLAKTLKQVGFVAGKDYDVLVTSIDPMDTPADGVAEKARFLEMLGQPDAASGVHFLTAPQSSIADLSQATGFNFVRIAGPDGRLSKYLFGIDYQPRDVRLAVMEASHHHIGSLSDLILLYCCNYSPTAGKYTVSILRVMGLAGMGSLFMLVGLLFALSRKGKGSVSAA